MRGSYFKFIFHAQFNELKQLCPDSMTSNEEIDYYSILNVNKSSSQEDIRRARIKRLRESHNNGKLQAVINEAFQVLGNESERKKYDKFGYCDVTQIRSQLFLGGESAAQHPSYLSKLGITHVLSCAHSMHYLSRGLIENGLQHMQLDVEDTDEQNITRYLGISSDFIRDALALGGSVLVHCQFGVSRSPSFMCHYLMITESLSFDQALEELQRLRPQVCAGDGFKHQ